MLCDLSNQEISMWTGGNVTAVPRTLIQIQVLIAVDCTCILSSESVATINYQSSALVTGQLFLPLS